MKLIQFIAPVFLSFTALSCAEKKAANEKEASVRTSFLDKKGMDSTVRPQDDFFEYANGGWIKTTEIPGDESGWGSAYILYNETQNNLKTLLEAAAASGAAKGSAEQKLGDLYKSGMDTVAIEKLGATPLKPILDKIDAIKDHKELMLYVAEAMAKGDDAGLISFNVNADEKNSTVNIVNLYQSGISLPEKGYYTKQDSATKAARAALVDYATRLFMLTGTDSATALKSAASILSLETELAKYNRSPVELRDPQKNYNKMNVRDLDKQGININWPQLFAKADVKVDSVNVGQPEYYIGLSKLLSSMPIDAWKSKVKFQYISNNALYLNKAFVNARFNYRKVFNGRTKDEARWKKIVAEVDFGLPEMLGQLYVKKYFTEAAKKRMDELVNNLQKAFEARIKKLDWMSDSTRQRALTKLNAFLKKIGYPEKWKNYDDVIISSDNFFGNMRSIQAHLQKETLAKIGKPVDRTEWQISAPTINAYYNPTFNEIVFPAGILQFPFFDVNADDAINYGAIGMVIGHEMTHGFDDQGSQYDEKGNMQNWWSAVDADKFKAKTGGVVNLYSKFTVLDSLHVNGELTLGENLADIGGLAIAYDAFKMTKQAQSNEKIDGFTPDQRFFLSFAQIWRLKRREAGVRVALASDPHSPEKYRVNGPVMNFDPFYQAFDVKEGDKMYIRPGERARIW